jgi:hypothetical protein
MDPIQRKFLEESPTNIDAPKFVLAAIDREIPMNAMQECLRCRRTKGPLMDAKKVARLDIALQLQQALGRDRLRDMSRMRTRNLATQECRVDRRVHTTIAIRIHRHPTHAA